MGMPPPFGMPPAGFPGAAPGMPPPFFGGPPPFGMPPPNFAAQPQQAYPWGNIHPTQWLAIKKDDDEVDPNLVARAAEWSEHKAPDGRSYYYNATKNESVWEKPEVLKELEGKNFYNLIESIEN